MKKAFFLTIGLILFSFHLLTAQQWWTDLPESGLPVLDGPRWIQPQAYRSIDIDLDAVQSLLADAPLWFTPEAANPLMMTFPMPDGSTRTFGVVEAPVMSPELAAKYPGMRSFAGKSPEDGTAYARFGYTHKGFHAMIRSGRHSTIYIDVLTTGQNRYHQVYYRKDYPGIPGNVFTCEVDEGKPHGLSEKPGAIPEVLGDCNLRTYRLALACTGEYANFHGGNIPDVMAEYNVAMTRVNGVYETDVTVHMELVPNTDLLIFFDPATDPYTNNNGGAMLGQNQTTCNNIIGFNNYDIGHVFSTGGGGIANLNAPCTNNKARGVTGLPSPVGDPFYIDYVAHEMGHQYGANHTQNNSCNRNNATAMEPGSASTIMGYAGICAPNVQNNSDDHFHAISIQEMTQFIENGSGGNCPVTTPLGNTGPTVTTQAMDYTLPVSTPFFLTAIANDPDDDELTYCWEQMDNQIATMPPQPTNAGGPAFRSNSPTLSPTRYFPNLGAVINGTTPTWEVIPSVSRNMNFRVSVRDNFMGGGCVNSANVSLSFTNQAGPFVVLNPNTAVSWTAGTPQTITWDVANTDQAPVSCDLADIYLSLDGGLSYPIQLADDVPNTGAFNLVVPNEPTTQARVQVVCADNIFFDISDENFEIVEPAEPTFLASVSPTILSQCVANSDPEFTIGLVGLAGFSEPISFSVDGLPTGVTATFSPDPATPGSDATLTLSDFQSAMPGEYTLEITCMAPSASQTVTAVLNIIVEAPSSVVLEEPADGSQGHPLNALLSWDPTFFASSYFVEISTSPAFGADVIETATVSNPSYEATQLQPFTLYFWRVTSANDCGSAPPQEVFVFQTGGSLCTPFVDDNPGLVIPGNQTGSWSATLNISEDVEIDDINVLVNLQHTWIGDVAATVEGPAGQSVTLFDQPGVPASQYGCGEDNLFVIFDDEASLTAAELENTCGTGPYAIQGSYQAIDPLSVFDGSSSQGDWTITFSDIFNQDGGNLVFWSLVVCRQPLATNLVEVSNNPLLVASGATGNIPSSFLEYERVGIDPAQITYMLLELPAHGQLLAGGSPLTLGATFTQAQINTLQLVYQHDGSAPLTDAFRFHVYDNEDGWIQNEQFDIQIASEVPLSGFAIAGGAIQCFGDPTASIEVEVFGGAPPYQYSLNGGPFQSGNLFEGLPAGVYAIEVVDNLGNQLLLPVVEFAQPDLLEAEALLSGNTLEGTAMGGTEPYAYSLDGVDYQPEGLFEELPNGDYILYVQDANGCTAVAAFSINLILSAALQSGDVSCFGINDGFIAVTSVEGGESPYTYSLNGGAAQSAPAFENLPAGAYDLLIEDSQGQTFQLTGIVIGEPSELLLDVMVMGDTIDIGATGGIPPYLYSLDGGQTFSEDALYPGLPNGDYEVLVRDANDCLSEIQVVTVLISGTADLKAAWRLRLLPNPTAGAFSLEGIAAAARLLNWQVVDLTGRILYSGELNAAAGYWSQAFDLPLPPGAYWVRVVSGEEGSAALSLIVVE